MHSNHRPNTKIVDAIKIWAKIGFLSFGGPAAQIALMHKIVVDEKGWLEERQFLNAINFCMLLPGPEAMQLATYVGWRMHGVLGGLIAGMLFVLPGAFVILTLASVYSIYGHVDFVQSVFLGIKAAVIIIVVEALIKVSKRALKSSEYYLLALIAFVGIFALSIPFPIIIIAAAVFGYFRADKLDAPSIIDTKGPLVSAHSTLFTILVWLIIWSLPFGVLWAMSAHEILLQIAVFFSKLAIVTFGGAYAVLAYMAQDVVLANGWLSAVEMVDGLGLAETTPGPLILVTEFVGFLAAEKVGGFWLGIAGAAVTLWVTFVPCFLWIFAGAPYLDWVSAQPRLASALSAITAAVVGVILNLSIWFAINVLFASAHVTEYWVFSFLLPDWATADWSVFVLSVIASILLLQFKWNLVLVLAISAAGGALLSTF